MSNKSVFIDLQDGTGWRDISAEVLYRDFSIDYKACSDNFHYAQNTCSFTIRHNSTLYPLIRDTQKDILVQIKENTSILFTGRAPSSKLSVYNGILDNTSFSFEATDNMMQLDKTVGDIAYWSYKIMDSTDIPHSIVHQLAYLCGFTESQIDATISIPTILTVFVPSSPDDTVLEVMDNLLFEYGYILNMSNDDKISPLKWMLSANTYSYTFDNSNIIKEVVREETVRKYDGAEVTYYDLTTISSTLSTGDILVYRDTNLPVESNGVFSGYPIPAGYTYPPMTNVDDDTQPPGTKMVVYQDYDDTSIKYWTNKAIVNHLDYNYKAFESDYSDMVATRNHRIEWRADTGITLDTETYYNRKARLVFRNPTGGILKLYYALVYAEVFYKSAERKSYIVNIAGSDKLDKYVSMYIYSKEHADRLVQYLAKQHEENDYNYKFYSSHYVAPGSLVRVLLDEGTDRVCFVTGVVWDESKELWSYT